MVVKGAASSTLAFLLMSLTQWHFGKVLIDILVKRLLLLMGKVCRWFTGMIKKCNAKVL